jgi:hypothetical protein
MSYKRIIFIVIGGFIALLLMNTNIEVTAEDFTPTPTPIPWYACPAGQYGGESAGYVCVDADPGYYVDLQGQRKGTDAPQALTSLTMARQVA